MSTGLIYEPGRYAKTEELVELVGEMRGTGALYATHMRNEGVNLLESVDEAIEIGSRAGVPVQISHHKASGRESWGKVRESIKLIEAAQARGQSVHADQYPYTAGSTSLNAVLVNGAFADDLESGIGGVLPEDVVIASAPDYPQWEGRSIAQLCETLNLPPREASERIVDQCPGTTVVMHMMSEEDVQLVLRHPSTIIGSDGLPTLDGKPHPRLYNTFARVLGHYSRDLKLFDLQTAIYRMTGFAADKFALRDRGRVVEGAYADLVLFDADAIIDKGTFENPNQYPVGISDVFVNGLAAVRDSELTKEFAGRVIRRGN
jgi:N-acyl-D-amino-acid deacylase